jgi:hypothetical protein
MSRPHIQVILADNAIPDCLPNVLNRIEATAGFWPLSEALHAQRLPRADAIVVIVPPDISGIAGPLRVLFDRLAEHPRATLVLSCDGVATRLRHPATLPVTFVDAVDEHDLCGRLATMLEMRDSLDSLHRLWLSNRRSGESIAKQYVSQLRLASQVQREFLPEALPQYGTVSFDVLFRPVDYVSGDIYDVHRLDEQHVGIAVADATGHGIPAALLTVYIKRALRGKEIENGNYRILSPDEVLLRLNEDILDAHLNECPFVAVVYGVLDVRTLELCIARGGAPYPLLRQAGGETSAIVASGGVVGVLPDREFEVSRMQLSPGDSVLLYSDGLERIVAPQETVRDVPETLRLAAGRIAGYPRIRLHGDEEAEEAATAVATLPAEAAVAVTAAEDGGSPRPRIATGRAITGDVITASPWYRTLEAEGAGAALDQLARRHRSLRRMGYPLDDLTVLCLNVAP